MKKKTIIIFFVILLLFFTISYSQTDLKRFFDDFENGTAENWQMNDPEKWDVVKEDNNHCYRLKIPAELKGPITKPVEFSLIKDLNVADFTMTLKGKCLRSVDVKGRDIIIVFGYQDDTHFYYAHISNYHDNHHNSILIVNSEDRKPIISGDSIPRLHDKEFHNIRIRRHIESGLIEVYVDDFDYPVMTAVDKTFQWGRIGVGCFDDTGSFDDVRIVGKIKSK